MSLQDELGGGWLAAAEAVAGHPVGCLLPLGVEAAQSHQARREEAQGESRGPAKEGGTLTTCCGTEPSEGEALLDEVRDATDVVRAVGAWG